jgi:hypothetical protein
MTFPCLPSGTAEGFYFYNAAHATFEAAAIPMSNLPRISARKGQFTRHGARYDSCYGSTFNRVWRSIACRFRGIFRQN